MAGLGYKSCWMSGRLLLEFGLAAIGAKASLHIMQKMKVERDEDVSHHLLVDYSACCTGTTGNGAKLKMNLFVAMRENTAAAISHHRFRENANMIADLECVDGSQTPINGRILVQYSLTFEPV